jgi:hypothetical protein
MRGKWATWSTLLGAAVVTVLAAMAVLPHSAVFEAAAGGRAPQVESKTPDVSSMYCSGIVTSDRVPQDHYIISGEESNIRITFFTGDLVYINRGTSSGAKLGDRFQVVRPEHDDPLPYHWFKGQFELMRAMGTRYQDLGWVHIAQLGPKVSTAAVDFSCDLMQRGDLVLPYVERPAPPLKPQGIVDPFAPVDSKSSAGMLVSTRSFGQVLGTNGIGYVNLGAAQGLAVGSYVRVWRYAGPNSEVVPQEKTSAYAVYGWGSAPQRYTAEELPREILGEAIVLRVTPHTATIMITGMRRDIYVGDYVEVEK